MCYSALSIANALIKKAEDKNITDLTPMKLQKLMFFAQSWYLKKYSKRLILDNFERWDYGPVIPSVYYTFNIFKSNVINKLATGLDCTEIKTDLKSKDDNFLDELLAVYGKFDGWRLSLMTHQDKTAWSMGALGTTISLDEMVKGKV